MVWKVCVSPYNSDCSFNHIFRCTARAKNLDNINALPRSREHSNALVETLELGELWDQYGLVGDVVVSAL